jgi:hypothetical protein
MNPKSQENKLKNAHFLQNLLLGISDYIRQINGLRVFHRELTDISQLS